MTVQFRVVHGLDSSMDWIEFDWVGLDGSDNCYVPNYAGLCFSAVMMD